MSNIFTPTRWSTIPNPALLGWENFTNPCYDPQAKYGDCPKTLLDVLNDERIPTNDRVWAFCHCTLVPDNVKCLFGVRCIRETPTVGGGFVADALEDQRSLDALIVSEKYAYGEASENDLINARAAAWSARSAAESPAELSATYAVSAWMTWVVAYYVEQSASQAAWMSGTTYDVAVVWTKQLKIARSFLSE